MFCRMSVMNCMFKVQTVAWKHVYSVYWSLCDVTNCCRKEGMENYTTLNVIKHAYKLNIKHIVDPTEVGNKCRVIFLNSLYHKVDLRQYHVNALKNCLGEASSRIVFKCDQIKIRKKSRIFLWGGTKWDSLFKSRLKSPINKLYIAIFVTQHT